MIPESVIAQKKHIYFVVNPLIYHMYYQGIERLVSALFLNDHGFRLLSVPASGRFWQEKREKHSKGCHGEDHVKAARETPGILCYHACQVRAADLPKPKDEGNKTEYCSNSLRTCNIPDQGTDNGWNGPGDETVACDGEKKEEVGDIECRQ